MNEWEARNKDMIETIRANESTDTDALVVFQNTLIGISTCWHIQR
jgi:hypothetical protein